MEKHPFHPTLESATSEEIQNGQGNCYPAGQIMKQKQTKNTIEDYYPPHSKLRPTTCFRHGSHIQKYNRNVNGITASTNSHLLEELLFKHEIDLTVVTRNHSYEDRYDSKMNIIQEEGDRRTGELHMDTYTVSVRKTGVTSNTNFVEYINVRDCCRTCHNIENRPIREQKQWAEHTILVWKLHDAHGEKRKQRTP